MRISLKTLVSFLLIVVLSCSMITGASAQDYGYLGAGSSPAKISLREDSSAALAVGGKLQLSAVSSQDGSSQAIISCTSSKPAVATVDGSQVTAKKKGSAVITVNMENGESCKLQLTVVDPSKPDGVKFSKKSVTTYVGMKTDVSKLLQGKPYAAAINPKSVKWSSSNTKVATVKNGVILAQGTGTAKITAKTKNKKTAEITIKVKRNKTGTIRKKPSLSAIGYGQEIYLKSVEIVSPKKVVCEYYLLFKRLSSIRTTHFSWIEDQIYYFDNDWNRVTIVDGTVRNIKISTRGQTVKVFKVTYTGKAVKNTNVKLSAHKKDIYNSDEFWLNWLY